MIWLVVTVCLSSAQQPGAAAGLNPPSPSASRRYSNPGDVALIRSPAGCRADRMMGSGAHLSGVSSLLQECAEARTAAMTFLGNDNAEAA